MELLLGDEEAIGKISRATLSGVLKEQAKRSRKFLLYDSKNDIEPFFLVEDEKTWDGEINKMISANPGKPEKLFMIELIKKYSMLLDNPSSNIGESLKILETKLSKMIESATVKSTADTKPMLDLLEQFGKLKADLSAKPPRIIDKVDKNIGPFWGNPNEKIEDWLYVIHNWQKLHAVPENRMIPILTPLIRGNALQLLKTFGIETGGRGTWSDFEKQLVALYDPEHKKRKLRQELRSLRQTGTNFTDFTHKFQSIAVQLTMTQEELVDLFTDSLMPKTKLMSSS